MFSSPVESYWALDPEVSHTGSQIVRVVEDASLPANRSLSILRTASGRIIVSGTPQLVRQLGLTSNSSASSSQLAEAIKQADISLNDPDHLFYLPIDEQACLLHEPVSPYTRQLTNEDATIFEAMVSACPEDDLDEAFVELDHWLVYGTFVDGRLASAASMYPWKDTTLADLGVITMPEFRSRGLARDTVRAISARALRDGYEPQYRCQLDNAASAALARSAGFALFGEWSVIDVGD